MDNLIFSSAIMGLDPESGEVPDDGERQVELVFSNLRSFLMAADAEPDDVGKLTIFLADNELRAAINVKWCEMFPDEQSRPARHIIVQQLPRNFKIQIEVIAVSARHRLI